MALRIEWCQFRATLSPLVTDLKQRGLLDDTIVAWGGEFGRTTFSQSGKVAESYGRDHHANCFTKIVAGGGFKAGLNHGQTDDLCYRVVEDEVPGHDLHATILHQLGIDHERLTSVVLSLPKGEGRGALDLLGQTLPPRAS